MAYLTRPELLKTLACALKESERNWAMCLVGVWHGLRATEIVSLKSENIKDDYLVVKRLKHSKKTEQQMYERPETPLLNEAPVLKKLAREANGGYLFPGRYPGTHLSRCQLYRVFRRAAEAAGLKWPLTHPHCLKHTIAMLTLENGANVATIQEYLGHKSGQSTLQYLKISAEEAGRAVGKVL